MEEGKESLPKPEYWRACCDTMSPRNKYVYTYLYMHVITVNKIKDHRFEGEQNRVSGKIWGGEKERVK